MALSSCKVNQVRVSTKVLACNALVFRIALTRSLAQGRVRMFMKPLVFSFLVYSLLLPDS